MKPVYNRNLAGTFPQPYIYLTNPREGKTHWNIRGRCYKITLIMRAFLKQE